MDFVPFYLSAREISDSDVSRVLQSLRGISSIHDLILDEDIDLRSLSLRSIREGFREEYNSTLEELERLKKEAAGREEFRERFETLMSKLRQLSRGVLTWFPKTGVLRVETAALPDGLRRRQLSLKEALDLYRQLVDNIDGLLRVAVKSASTLNLLPEIISHVRLVERIAEQVSV